MSWESVLKAEKVFILSEEMSMGYNEVIGVFRSREALDKYLLETNPEFKEEGRLGLIFSRDKRISKPTSFPSWFRHWTFL